MKVNTFKTYYPAIVVFISLFIFSIFAFYLAKLAAEDQRQELFQRRAQSITDGINLRMADYIQILKGCQGLFYGSDSITARDWKVYVNNLNLDTSYPGIQAIAYAPLIPISDTLKLEQEIQKSGFPNFKIRSEFKRSHLTPIIYIEPFAGRNIRAFGFDMYNDDTRREAMDRALLTGKAAMTSKVRLVQETSENVQPGFLLYLPIYKDPFLSGNLEDKMGNTKGFVYYPFRAHDLMKYISKNHTGVNIKLYDGDEVEESKLLFDSYENSPDKSIRTTDEPDFSITQKMILAGTPWTLKMDSNDEVVSPLERSQPFLVLLFGLLISVFAFFMIYNTIKRNRQIRTQLELAKQLDNKKDEFIGIASHELKTPLTSIKAYVQLLERSQLGEKERDYVIKATSNIKKLSNLIGDLLDVSKLQSGQLSMNVAPIELQELITESVENVQHMYTSHQIIVQNTVPDLLIHGDIVRLEQALTNLLINGIKYSPGAKSIHIKTEHVDSRIKISVIDQGIGISKENQERIFDRFFRARDLSPVLSGLGMGLYISAEIVRRHKGEITVQSEPDKGATFTVCLPA